jgi:vancomycin resistance protein YoaR
MEHSSDLERTELRPLSAVERVRLRRRQHAVRRRRGFMLRVLLTCAVTTLVLVVAWWFTAAALTGRRVLPGISLRGFDLGWKTASEVQGLIEANYSAFLIAPLTLTFGDETWSPTAGQLGLRIEGARAAAESIALGANSWGPGLFHAVLQTDMVAGEVPLRLTIDERQLQRYLLEIAKGVDQPPQDAQLQIAGGRVVITPARPGRQVLIDDTVRDALAALQTLTPQEAPLRTRVLQPAIDDADVAPVARLAETILAGPLTLTAGDQRWAWSQAELGMLLRIEQSQAGEQNPYQLTISQELVRAWLTTFAPVLARPAVEPRLRYTAAGLRIITEGRNGAALEVERAADQIVAALRAGRRTVELPVAAVLPRARPETLNMLGIVELVAQGKSDFSGSAAYRVQNISAGAARMDGLLIAPGQEFSFNREIGPIDASNGFTEGYAIIDGRTQLEWGGGVCQVSTTVFRAAFWAGVPITERNQHSFRISWYEVYEPMGMDAAIFTGPSGYDLRFVNDTGNWLLLEARVDTGRATLTVNLYGTRPNREVRQLPVEIRNEVPAPSQPRYIDDPALPAGTVRQTDTARGGQDVTVRRVVLEGGQVVREDSFFSRFQPWPNIYVRGTGS